MKLFETPAGPKTHRRACALDGHGRRTIVETLATEEPLEIRLQCGFEMRPVALTMRTPGHDFELAAGFLYGEGVIRGRDDIASIAYCTDERDAEQNYNAVTVRIAATTWPNLDRLDRHFTATSACGVCGKASAEALRLRTSPIASEVRVPFGVLATLPQSMREAQAVFEATGGLHAAALFDPDGALIAVREDIGRHNALDKLIGWALLEQRSVESAIACVSGRASYELVQKCIVSRIPVLCAVSAPSSLAASLAAEFGLTLAAFVRDGRATIYALPDRIT